MALHVTRNHRPEDRQSALVTTFASTYARLLNHLHGALGCFIKANIHLFEIRTTASISLFDDPSSAIQPVLDMHEDTRRMLGLAELEANALGPLIQEVSLLPIHIPACHTKPLYFSS